MNVHSHHDEISRAVRSWFINSAPEIGYFIHRYWFGFLSEPGRPFGARLILTVEEPELVASALSDAIEFCRPSALTIWVDDRTRHRTLDEALLTYGCESVKATTHLALVGSINAATPEDDISFEDVTIDSLGEWVRVKIQCFDNDESEPTTARLERELAVRTPELALSGLELARIGNEPVGVLGYYPGDDQLLFNVGTRTPYRHRGIAQSMIAHCAEKGLSSGSRSLIINADDLGAPAALYRHMGFVDEVYWYWRYELATAPS